MAGHSKWAQIKRKKGAEDAKRGQRFAMLARMIAVEAKKAGGDREAFGLRQAILRAKAENLPNENIERAIQNALGGRGEELKEVLYEAYGPGGVALIIEGITDNPNRTTNEIKHLLAEHRAALAGQGAVRWAFTKTAEARLPDGQGWQPVQRAAVDEVTAPQIAALCEALEEHPDIKAVFTNL